MFTSPLSARALRGAVAGLFVLSTVGASAALAQDNGNQVSTRVVVGAIVPTGALKDEFGSGGLVGVQVRYPFMKYIAAEGTMSWANAPTQRTGNIADYAIAWTYDAGLEVHTVPMGGSWMKSGFVGAGVGSRAYELPTSIQGSTTSFAGYGAVGGDMNQKDGHWGFHAEVRDYQTSFTDIQHSIPRQKGSDMTLLLGLTFR